MIPFKSIRATIPSSNLYNCSFLQEVIENEPRDIVCEVCTKFPYLDSLPLTIAENSRHMMCDGGTGSLKWYSDRKVPHRGRHVTAGPHETSGDMLQLNY